MVHVLSRSATVLAVAALLGWGCDLGTPSLGHRLPEVKRLFESTCSNCHPLDIPLRRHKSLPAWRDTVAIMRGHGAELTDTQAEDVAAYLALIRGR